MRFFHFFRNVFKRKRFLWWTRTPATSFFFVFTATIDVISSYFFNVSFFGLEIYWLIDCFVDRCVMSTSFCDDESFVSFVVHPLTIMKIRNRLEIRSLRIYDSPVLSE